MISDRTRIAYLKRMLKRLEGEEHRLERLIVNEGYSADAERIARQLLEKSREEVISELRKLEGESKVEDTFPTK